MIGTWRQVQAQQNLQDGLGNHFGESDADRVRLATDAAIEVATTVKITREALDAMAYKIPTRDALTAALVALGFEVVQ